MKIHVSLVSYNTPLREAQVKLMAHSCRKLQALWDDTHTAFGAEADWIERECVQAFFLAAEACVFVCKEWGVMESLSTRAVDWEGVPEKADLKWLRFFIHSMVVDEKSALAGEFASRMSSVTFELGKKRGYTDLAAALEAQLS